MMGACVSSGSNEDGDQKKRSQMIDRGLEEDSKKLRRECKILLLGMSYSISIRSNGMGRVGRCKFADNVACYQAREKAGRVRS